MPKGNADGYLRDPDGNFILDEYGNMIRKPKPPTNKSSATAERGRAEMRGRNTDKKLAKKKALEKLRKQKSLTVIPASPTR